jgi:YVTN family beta-propeller protein
MRRPVALAGVVVVSLSAIVLEAPQEKDRAAVPVDPPATGTAPSRFGMLTSRRWAYGVGYARENLSPVANPNPAPEPQPRRDHPFDVAVSADGAKVYVGLLGSELEPGNEVAVYDVAEEKVVKRIPLKAAGEAGAAGSSPYRLTLHPGGRFLVVTNRFSNFASVIDTHSDSVVSEIPLDFYCQGVAFDRGGHTAYVVNRYLDQVFVVDVEAGDESSFQATMRVLGGLNDEEFFKGVHPALVRSCGTVGCHDRSRGGFVAGPDSRESFLSVIAHVRPGDSAGSRLLRAAVRIRDGGYADRKPLYLGHAGGTVVFRDPSNNADYQAIARWIDAASQGPGIPVGNPRSKPKVCVLSTDGRHLFVGNTGTQDISIVDTKTLREVGAIYIQNAVDDVQIHHSSETGRDCLLVATRGVGFGVPKERDAYGGESWNAGNPAAHFSVWRDTDTGRILPRSEQEVLGPFDAVDGTAEIGFRDMQNDIVLIDITRMGISEIAPTGEPCYLLEPNCYEAHRGWVRYTSDTAESAYGDVKGDIPPDLMRVVGATPEQMAILGDRLFVTMLGSNQVQEWRIDVAAADPSDYLVPVRTYDTGLQPMGITAGPDGKLYVANFLGGSISVIDATRGESREVIVDPSVLRLPVPATNAERGEVFVRGAAFSSDGDLSCFHCHREDMNDGRAWGTHQVLAQEYLSERGDEARRAIGATMGVPQLRGLFGIQPLYFEGTFTAFEQPREAMIEQAPIDDFHGPSPTGDFSRLEAHVLRHGAGDPVLPAIPKTVLSTLEERRDEMFRRESMRYFGKAFTLLDVQRFAGEWQASEPRLLPNPFDQTNRSVLRGKVLYEDPQVGCVSCHPPPHFAKKDFADSPQQAFAPLVTFTARDGASTLIGMYRLDSINDVRRDLEPRDFGRVEAVQGHFTSFQLRGIWDRPPTFLHNGMARTLHEVVATPGHPGLRRLKYEPLIGGIPERPEHREIGFNMTWLFKERSDKVKLHMLAGARLGFDTHGGASHLTAQQVDDLVNFLNSIE